MSTGEDPEHTIFGLSPTNYHTRVTNADVVNGHNRYGLFRR